MKGASLVRGLVHVAEFGVFLHFSSKFLIFPPRIVEPDFFLGIWALWFVAAFLVARVPPRWRRAGRLAGLGALPLMLWSHWMYATLPAAGLFLVFLVWTCFGQPVDLIRLWFFGERGEVRPEGLEGRLFDASMICALVAVVSVVTSLDHPLPFFLALVGLRQVVPRPSRRPTLVSGLTIACLQAVPEGLQGPMPSALAPYVGRDLPEVIVHLAMAVWLLWGSPSRLVSPRDGEAGAEEADETSPSPSPVG